MSITVNILYTGQNGSARQFAQEMLETGIVAAIRAEAGNQCYDYYLPLEDAESVLLIDRWQDQQAIDLHHKTPMMEQIAALRKKHHLKMKVMRYTDL